MKKIFSLFAAVLMAGSMVATTVTVNDTIFFNTDAVKISADSVIGTSAQDATWTIVTKGTTSFTANAAYYQVGSSKKPATSITFSTTFSSATNFSSLSAKFGGFSGTAGDVALMVDTNSVGSGALNEANDVVVSSSSTASGTLVKVTVTNIAKGVKCFYIAYSYEVEAPSVEKPAFDVVAGSYYDPQTLHLTCATEGAAILYTTDGTDPVLGSASVYMPQDGIYLAEGTTTTIKAIAYNNDSENPQYSDVVEKTYSIATQYASLDKLVAAGAPAGQKVVVTLTNETIDSLYVSSNKKTNGVYLTAGGRMVEIYCYDVPEGWAVGGTISGTVKGEWKEYKGTWEVCPSSWNGITYKAPLANGPAITVDLEAGTFTITPANDEAIYMFMLLSPEVEGGISEDNAAVLAAAQIGLINADYTLEDFLNARMVYQGALSDISLDNLKEGGLAAGTYAMAAFVVEENDAILHTAEITSKITYVEFTIEDAPAVNPWCEKEIGHFAVENADPNSFVLLTITAIEGGKTRVTVAQDAAKNTKTFDYLQVTGLASVGADVEDGGETKLSVEFTTPTPDANGEITLEILWSNPGWPGRWMVQNIKAKATDACEVAIPTAIDNIEAGKAVKTIENGQVVIIRDGVRYNAVGAKL